MMRTHLSTTTRSTIRPGSRGAVPLVVFDARILSTAMVRAVAVTIAGVSIEVVDQGLLGPETSQHVPEWDRTSQDNLL